MKKIKKMILGIENQGDERVEALENKLLARSGLIIVALCALDFLIRGILLVHISRTGLIFSASRCVNTRR
ncbi:hypothetical protein SFC65_27835, partial [Priestia filamentosa]